VLETARGQFLFRVTPGAREFLLRDGTDLKYGARHLKRAIERHLVYPLANLLSTDQVRLGDILCIDWDSERASLSFSREAEDAAIPRLSRLRSLPVARAAQTRRGEPRGDQASDPHPEQRNDARADQRAEPRPEPCTYAELPEPAPSR
jgi:hypothetical protein